MERTAQNLAVQRREAELDMEVERSLELTLSGPKVAKTSGFTLVGRSWNQIRRKHTNLKCKVN